MKKQIFSLLLAFFFQGYVFACGGIFQQLHCGEIRYSIGTGLDGHKTSNPLEVSVTVTLYFDIGGFLKDDSVYANWGDGRYSVLYATSITADTAAIIAANGYTGFYQHIYKGSHAYDSIPSSGSYFISVPGQFRLSFVNNIEGGSSNGIFFYMEAQVVLDTAADFSNQAPVMLPPDVQFANTNIPFIMNPASTDPDGDSIFYDLMTPQEDHNSPVPAYESPGQFCNGFNGASSTSTIDHHTGVLSWVSPCGQGIFTVTTIARKYRNGRFLGSIMRDQNIYVSEKIENGLVENTTESAVQLFPNPAADQLFISGSGSQAEWISVYDMNGRKMKERNLRVSDTGKVSDTFSIDIASLSSGIYFIEVKDANAVGRRRFVKE